ncbi:hypothetical protein RUM44_006803 [Polyplax serrata]|uniref:Uncharacterized protein n=1 Tax=Polyplax serrata TaxID=468196 RepID=A0ABR1AJ49_POLSC
MFTERDRDEGHTLKLVRIDEAIKNGPEQCLPEEAEVPETRGSRCAREFRTRYPQEFIDTDISNTRIQPSGKN